MSSEKIIVLYERLSREDENLGESYSISNQKKLLEDYCREKGWTRFRHFTDDGISGTTFDRPSFKAMIQLVDCQHFFRQIFLGYFSDIVQAFDTLRKNVCGDDYTSLHNPIVLSSVLPAYGMFHSIQILFL